MVYDIKRFLDAQDNVYDIGYVTYDKALFEIKRGRKVSHWIWYVFPQLKHFGFSYNAKKYGIENLDEAREYYNNEILKYRLIEISEALLNVNDDNIMSIVGSIDAKKIKSCMTLFLEVDPDCNVFKDVLNRFYHGEKDTETLDILKGKA